MSSRRITKNMGIGRTVEQQKATLKLLHAGDFKVKKGGRTKSNFRSHNKRESEERKVIRGEIVQSSLTKRAIKRGNSQLVLIPKAFNLENKSSKSSQLLGAKTERSSDPGCSLWATNRRVSLGSLPIDDEDNIKGNSLKYKKVVFNKLKYDKIAAHGRIQVNFSYLRPVSLKGNKIRSESTILGQINPQKQSPFEVKINKNEKTNTERTQNNTKCLPDEVLRKYKSVEVLNPIKNPKKCIIPPKKNWIFQETLIIGKEQEEESNLNSSNRGYKNYILSTGNNIYKGMNNNFRRSCERALISTPQIRAASPFQRPQRFIEVLNSKPNKYSSSVKNINKQNTAPAVVPSLRLHLIKRGEEIKTGSTSSRLGGKEGYKMSTLYANKTKNINKGAERKREKQK